jgi:hypothetical protein
MDDRLAHHQADRIDRPIAAGLLVGVIGLLRSSPAAAAHPETPLGLIELFAGELATREPLARWAASAIGFASHLSDPFVGVSRNRREPRPLLG